MKSFCPLIGIGVFWLLYAIDMANDFRGGMWLFAVGSGCLIAGVVIGWAFVIRDYIDKRVAETSKSKRP